MMKKIRALNCIAIVWTMLGTGLFLSAATTPEISRGADVGPGPYDGMIDVYTDSVNPTTPNDDKGYVLIYYEAGTPLYYETYIKFDLTQIETLGFIPAGETVTGCVLRLYCNRENMATTSDSYMLRRLDETWDESTITWNTRPAVPSWVGTPGAYAPEVTGTWDDYATIAGSAGNGIDPPSPIDIDLQYYVDDGTIATWMTDDSTNFGWVIAPNNSSQINLTFRDSEYQGQNGPYHPALILTYGSVELVDADITDINVIASSATPDPIDQTITVTNNHTSAVTVTITESLDWLNISTNSLNLSSLGGSDTFDIDYFVFDAPLAGVNTGTITLNLSGTSQAPIVITVNLTVNNGIQGQTIFTPDPLDLTEGVSAPLVFKLGAEPNPDIHGPTLNFSITGMSSVQPNSPMLSMPSSVSFLTTGWLSGAAFMVLAPDDADQLDATGSLTFTAGTISDSVTVNVTDDDQVNIVVTTPLPSFDVTEDNNNGVLVQVALDNASASGDVDVTATGFIFFDTNATATSLTQTLTLSLNGLTQFNFYVYYTDDGNAVDETNLTFTIANASVGSPNALNSPVTVTINKVSDDEVVDYLPTILTALSVVNDDTAPDTFTLELSNVPAATETVSITGGAGIQVSLDDITYLASVNATFTTVTWNAPQTVYLRTTGNPTPGASTVTLSGLSTGVPNDVLPVTITDTPVYSAGSFTAVSGSGVVWTATFTEGEIITVGRLGIQGTDTDASDNLTLTVIEDIASTYTGLSKPFVFPSTSSTSPVNSNLTAAAPLNGTGTLIYNLTLTDGTIATPITATLTVTVTPNTAPVFAPTGFSAVIGSGMVWTATFTEGNTISTGVLGIAGTDANATNTLNLTLTLNAGSSTYNGSEFPSFTSPDTGVSPVGIELTTGSALDGDGTLIYDITLTDGIISSPIVGTLTVMVNVVGVNNIPAYSAGSFTSVTGAGATWTATFAEGTLISAGTLGIDGTDTDIADNLILTMTRNAGSTYSGTVEPTVTASVSGTSPVSIALTTSSVLNGNGTLIYDLTLTDLVIASPIAGTLTVTITGIANSIPTYSGALFSKVSGSGTTWAASFTIGDSIGASVLGISGTDLNGADLLTLTMTRRVSSTYDGTVEPFVTPSATTTSPVSISLASFALDGTGTLIYDVTLTDGVIGVPIDGVLTVTVKPVPIAQKKDEIKGLFCAWNANRLTHGAWFIFTLPILALIANRRRARKEINGVV